jgi:phosphate-selective porin
MLQHKASSSVGLGLGQMTVKISYEDLENDEGEKFEERHYCTYFIYSTINTNPNVKKSENERIKNCFDTCNAFGHSAGWGRVF